MAYVNAACAGHATIYSTSGKFRPVSNFTQLHALTLAPHSYALLVQSIIRCLLYLAILVDADHNIRDLHEGRALAQLGKLYQEQGYLTQSLSAFYRSYKIHEMLYGRHGHPEVCMAQ